MDCKKKDFRKLYEDLVKSDWFKRAYHNKSLGECPFDIPELKESEDERMLREIKRYLKEQGDKPTGLPNGTVAVSDMIAWLEKNKEQKPAEWDEYTKTNLDRALQIIKDAKGTLQGYQSDDGIYECDKAIECLEHFLYRGLEIEKSVEWSKNDTVFLNEITDFFENKTVRLQHELNMYAHWLKSLPERFNLQLKQKRQIKEGDKVSIHCRKDRREDITITYDGEVGEVIHVWDAKKHPWGHIIVQLNNGCNTGFYEDELEVLDESHWKPSEEQITAVKAAYSVLNSYDTWDEDEHLPTLMSLINDLQKLL